MKPIFEFETSGNKGDIIVDGVSFSYGDAVVLNSCSYNFQFGSKTAIVGPIGQGKTTLCNILSGKLEPSQGRVLNDRRCKIVKLDQHWWFPPLENAVEHITSLFSKTTNALPVSIIRKKLGRFGITRQTQTTPLGQLSGGEKSKVALFIVSLQKPDILILDEPTNHLDIDTVNSLAEALSKYNGTLIVASHNIHFIREVCEQIVVCEEGRLTWYDGTIDDYKEELI
jgi:ATPase subunit of ABC transporter with duplicated ATPase domains